MPRRKIVPDNSVLVPAYFNESLTPSALKWRHAVLVGDVLALAPEILSAEFLKVAVNQKAEHLNPHEFIDLVDDCLFNLMPRIVRVPSRDLLTRALELRRSDIYLPDAWYVACALEHKAELWVSHSQKDRLVKNARAAGAEVHLLNTWR
jgi:predicted nucleic acid-binding protein